MNNAFLALRSCVFYAVYALLTLTFAIILFIFQPFMNDKSRIRFLSYWGFLAIFTLRIFCGIRYQFTGAHNIPKDEPFVVLSNHQSQWETYCLGYLFKPICFVLKKELFAIPVFGWCLSKTKPIAIDRTNPRKALKDIQAKGLSRIQDDRLPVLIFPEGTRLPPTEVGKFSRSGAQLAINSGVNILYVAHNSGHCWIPGQFIKKPGIINVSISEVQSIAGKTSTELSRGAEAWVKQQLSTF